MVQLNKTHRVEDAPVSSPYDVIPASEQTVCITESDMKNTKSGDGQYLQCTLEVIEGTYRGRKVWLRLNLVNPNTTAVEIAERQLAELTRACGKQEVSDSNELHDIPFVAVLKVRKGNDDYADSNEVTAFKPAKTSAGNSVPWEE